MSTYINPNKPKPLKYDDCPPLVQEYINHLLAVKNNSKRSVNSYYIDIRLFLRFYARLKGYVPENTEIQKVKIKKLTSEQICSAASEDIYAFMYYLADDRNNKPAVRKHKLTALNSFYSYLMRVEHLIERNPVEDVEPPSLRGLSTHQPKYLTVAQARMLLNTTGGDFPARDYCILVLFLSCGMRLSELSGINLKDISDDLKVLKLRGKGNKERTAYLNDSCTDALAAYLQERNAIHDLIDENALIISKRTKKRITNRMVEYIVRKRISAAGLAYTGCTPHSLRHTLATMLLESGVADLPELAMLLGHESTRTTERYTHLNNERLASVVAASPLNKKT